MHRALFLIVSLIALASPASAGKNKIENVKDCEFFSIEVVMSKTSGALGNVLNGAVKDDNCLYDIRFHLAGQLVIVKGVRNYELTWPPMNSDTARRPPAPPRSPEDYVKGLDFGG
jgi:hypothetical protein